MRRLLLLILCLCSIWAAQGQVAYDWRYWFDQSPTYEQGSSEGTLHLDVDVSGLSKSLHQIHIQVRDTAGMFSEPVSKYFVVPDDGHGSDKLHYWFDQNNADLHVIDLGNGMFDLDVSHLESGFHTLHFQVSDALGIVSNPQNKMFYIPEKGEGRNKLYYWVDENSQTLATTDIQESMTLDFSHLESGYHTLHFIATDRYGAASEPMHRGFIRATDGESLKWRYWFDDALDESVVMPPTTTSLMIDVDSLADGVHYIHFQAMDEHFSETKTQMFIKVPKTMNLDEMYCLVLIDNMLYSKETINMKNGGMATLNLDVKKISQGLHKLDVMVMTPSGALSSAYNSYFLRGYLNDERGALRCLYSFDEDADVHETTYSEGMSHLDIDVAHLEDGPHTVRWMLADKEGAYVSDKRSWFIKLPLGGNAVAKYCYWLNDVDSVKHESVLAEPKNPYDLIALLPVETMPLRSSCFHFEVKDNQPMMYAKNDIHFTFTDKFDRETNISKQYVDYNVHQDVNDITELMQTQTFERPEYNSIKWFKFDAAPGDSIAFRSSQATSLQVFAPSGMEIYAASGDKSVKYGGAHTWEEGTYYVAVHDVTSTKPNITLDYMHMDKYDVVSQDVRVVGNGGCSTITFQGNGFRDLYAVDLYTAQGDTIHSAHIDYLSDAIVAIRFNFTHASIGGYKAVFHFTEGEKILNSCISVEESKDMNISYDVAYASAFLRGTANTYTIRIKNAGNSTAYQVPLKIQLQAANGTKDITYIKLSDNLYSDNFKWLDDESIPEKERIELLELIRQKGNMLDFITVKDTIENEEFMEGYFAINLLPNSTTTFTISVKSNSMVTVYTLLPDEWDFYAYSNEHLAKSRRIRKASVKESMCCARTHVECGMNIIATGLDYASLAGGGGLAIASCIASLANTWIPFAYDAWCGEYDNHQEEIQNSLIRNSISALISCASKYDITKIGWMLQHVNDVFTTATSCLSHPKEIPNCPPDPPKPHPSSPVISFDPNDIYGYVAQSGSKYVGEQVMNLPYRIEFENDTTFATASAHTVVVRDTLDSTKFDLASYQPTSIMIGDKNVQLKGDKEFVTTVDMRPEIYAIAQVEGMYDEEKGIATWKFTSLDPMTMEETDDVMQGFLPVNYDGSGIGEVAYNINRKAGLADGTEISNKASIIFDNNDAIETPIWTNTIDAVPPTSRVSQLEIVGNDSVCVHFEGEDERSGVWKYELYVQHGDGSAWWKEAETDSTCCGFHFYNNIKYSFCVLATDSAGNVERKEFAPEKILYVGRKGDVNTDGEVNVTDIVYTADHILGNADDMFDAVAADMNDDKEINVTDIVYIADEILNGDVDQRLASKSNMARTITNSADALPIEPFNIDSGETKVITLDMNNAGYDITAFQCDITLPNGLHIAKSGSAKQGVSFSKETKRAEASSHSLVVKSNDAGVNRVVCYSVTNAPFFGYTGAVLDIPVTADATMADGEYTVLIDNITMTCKDKTQLKPAPVMVKISVNNATSVHSLNADDPSAEYYDAGGRKRDTVSKGVNIIRKDDNVNKVLR